MTPLLRRTGNDDRAFERLYQRHVRDVFRYSLAVLGETADAEDVTQTTFMNAYRAFKRGERPQKPENWLISIAHNVCRQRFRQAQRRPREVEYADELAPALEESDGPTAEDLRRAFSLLPPNQRAALVMRELEGRSYAEIAAVLEISVSALETLLFRARRALREQLEEQLTCQEAELAISRQLDGRLSRGERGMLRAHLRACPECAHLAQSQRAQRKVLRGLLAVPLPAGLTSFFHPAAEAAATTAVAATGTGVAVKAAAVVAGAALVGGGTYAGVEKVPALVKREHPARVAAKAPAAVPAAATTAVAPRDVGVRLHHVAGDVAVHHPRPKRDVAVHRRHGNGPPPALSRGQSAEAKAAAPGQARSAAVHEANQTRQEQRRLERQQRAAAKAEERRAKKKALAERKAEHRATHGPPAGATPEHPPVRGTQPPGQEKAAAKHGTPPGQAKPKAHGRR